MHEIGYVNSPFALGGRGVSFCAYFVGVGLMDMSFKFLMYPKTSNITTFNKPSKGRNFQIISNFSHPMPDYVS